MMGGMQIGRVPLVGRQADLEALRDEIAAVGRSGRAVVVSGDAGMGKTRLLRDFTHRATAGDFVAIPSSRFRNSRESSCDQPVPQPPT